LLKSTKTKKPTKQQISTNQTKMASPFNNCSDFDNFRPPEYWQSITNPARTRLALVMGIIYIIIVIVCYVVWIFAKHNYGRRWQRLRIRPSPIVTAAAIGAIVQITLAGLFRVAVTNAYPCPIRTFGALIVIPLVGLPPGIRLLVFRLMSSFQNVAAAFRQGPDHYSFHVVGDSQSAGVAATSENGDNNADRFIDMKATFSNQQSVAFLKTIQGLRLILSSPASTQDGKPMSYEEAIIRLKTLKFLYSRWGTISLVVMFLVPYITISLIVVDFGTINCTGCLMSTTQTAISLLFAALCFVWGIYCAWKVRNLPDQNGLRRESLLVLLVSIIGLAFSVTDGSRERANPLPSGTPYNDQIIVGFCATMTVVVQTIPQVFLAYRANLHTTAVNHVGGATQAQSQVNTENHHHSQHATGSNVESITAGTNNTKSTTISSSIPLVPLRNFPLLLQIVNNEEKLRVYEEHLSTELSGESLMFLRAAREFKITYYDLSEQVRLSRAKKIHHAYIAFDGLFTINISSQVTERITTNIFKKKNITPELFDPAIVEVCQMLERDAPRFNKKWESLEFKNAGTNNNVLTAIA
jgi:hypothetical protein